MSPKDTITGGWGCRRWTHRFAALALVWGGSALAQDVVSVPAAHLHHAEGSVAWAPQGDKEWHDVQPRRLLKRGDRLWVDRGSRAEVQAGGHALRLNGETQLILENVGETATQLSLTQGSIVATVTGLNPGDSFEVGTPNLAFRARQPGDYRIDVDTKKGITRLVVISGLAVVYGEKGEALEVRSGHRAIFRERDLDRVQQPLFAATDDFDRWAGARRRGEPTVSMPLVARTAPPPPPATAYVNKGRDIIISGSAADVAASSGIPAKGTSRVLAPQAAAAAQAAVAPAQLPQASARPIPTTAAVQSPPSAKPIPTTAMQAAPLRVMIPAAPSAPTASQAQAQLQAAQEKLQAQAAADAQARAAARAQAQAEARSAAQAEARIAAQAQAAAREQQDRQRRLAAQHREEERRAVARAEQERRSAAAAEAKRAEERRRAVAAKRAEEDRHHAHARRDAEQKRVAAAKRAEEERRQALAKRIAEEKRQVAIRRAETQKILEAQKLAESRRLQLARLQEQARRDEQSVQARREQQARRAEEERREEQARREDAARREELARREEDYRRQRALADQVRREQARRDEEVWLRQQQQVQPMRPAPMGVPIRRVS